MIQNPISKARGQEPRAALLRSGRSPAGRTARGPSGWGPDAQNGVFVWGLAVGGGFRGRAVALPRDLVTGLQWALHGPPTGLPEPPTGLPGPPTGLPRPPMGPPRASQGLPGPPRASSGPPQGLPRASQGLPGIGSGFQGPGSGVLGPGSGPGPVPISWSALSDMRRGSRV